jgi:hypothetical protein
MSCRMDEPDNDTYTETRLQACGHWQTWEQFRGLPMHHDPAALCWECESCEKCRLKRSDCRCDPFDDEPFPTLEEERARMTAEEAKADLAWEQK